MLAVNKENGGGWSSVLRSINPVTLLFLRLSPGAESWMCQRGENWFRVRISCCGRWREGKGEAASRERALEEAFPWLF